MRPPRPDSSITQALLPQPVTTTVPRLALSKTEAAESLGVSVDYLEEHVMPDLRVVRRGRRRLIPVSELERWLERNAAITLTSEVA